MSWQAESELEVQHVWERYWRDLGDKETKDWDVISRTVLLALAQSVGAVDGKTFLEVGCGTGRISAELQRHGATVNLLDISAEALALARGHFARLPAPSVEPTFVRASMFSLPYPDAHFDVVWNAGVLEHFTDDEQRHALQEMLRVTKPDGRLVVLVPYRYSPLYRFGKFVMEKTGRWPYGIERPVASYRAMAAELGAISVEHCTSFLPLAEQVFSHLPGIGKSLAARCSARWLALDDARFARLDRALSRVLRGHLLCCAIRRSAR